MVDAYRCLEAGEPKETVQEFMAPFCTDFVPATQAFVRAAFPPQAPPDLVEFVVADMSAVPPAIALPCMKSAFTNEDAVIAGLRDAAVPVVAANSMRAPTDVTSLAHHAVTTVHMPQVGHFRMMEEPETFNRLLAEVLARLQAHAG